MKTEYLVFMLFIAVLFGVTAAIIKTLKKSKQEKGLKIFEEMMKDSVAVECLDGTLCSQWFRNTALEFKGKKTGFLLYPTKKYINALGFECPEELDLTGYVLLLLMKKDKRELLAYRLINFTFVNPELKEKLDKSGAMQVEL